MVSPLVSAVIPTYQRYELAQRAIKSVLAQTYEPLEIIVVEDGSDSGVEAWLQDKGLNHIRYVRHEQNKGLAAARNTGLKLANGAHIAYLDDDDEWKPQRIEKQIQLLATLTPQDKSRLGVIYCGTETRLSDQPHPVIGHPVNRGNLRDAIIRDGAITLSSTFLFSRAALDRVGGFDETLPSSIDVDIWMSLATGGYDVQALDEPLVITYDRRGRETMMSSTTQRIQGVRMYVEKWTPVYQEWFGEAAGMAYGHRYFAHVIGSLAARKLKTGKLAEAKQAIYAVFKYSSETRYNFYVLYTAVGAHRLVPRRLVAWLKAMNRI